MDGTAKVIVLGVLAAMLAGCATLMIDGVLLERGVWAVDAAYGTTNLFLSAVPATLELSGADIVVTFRTDLGTLRLRYLDETIDGDRARVGLLILTRRDVNIPVEVRLVRRDERWLIWDVVLDGISVVGNYRAQFDRILKRSEEHTSELQSLAYLVCRLLLEKKKIHMSVLKVAKAYEPPVRMVYDSMTTT